MNVGVEALARETRGGGGSVELCSMEGGGQAPENGEMEEDKGADDEPYFPELPAPPRKDTTTMF